MARRRIFRVRRPSLKKKIAARTSLKRKVRHNLGMKAPRGTGWLKDPKRAARRRVDSAVGDATGGCCGGATALLIAVGVAAAIAACTR